MLEVIIFMSCPAVYTLALPQLCPSFWSCLWMCFQRNKTSRKPTFQPNVSVFLTCLINILELRNTPTPSTCVAGNRYDACGVIVLVYGLMLHFSWVLVEKCSGIGGGISLKVGQTKVIKHCSVNVFKSS